MAKFDRQNGFTLIELLVVILIISVLSGVMISTLNIQGTKAKSRDAQRIGDLKKIQTALESYYMDYRYYPDTGDSWVKIDGVADTLSIALSVAPNNYLADVPVDPIGEGASTGSEPCSGSVDDVQDYYYSSNGDRYRIISYMEIDRSVDSASACSALGCNPVPVNCYEVNNP